jgi:hypothetical protein
MMRPKAKAVGLISIVPVGRKDIHYYTNGESLLSSFPIVMGIFFQHNEKVFPTYWEKSQDFIILSSQYNGTNTITISK